MEKFGYTSFKFAKGSPRDVLGWIEVPTKSRIHGDNVWLFMLQCGGVSGFKILFPSHRSFVSSPKQTTIFVFCPICLRIMLLGSLVSSILYICFFTPRRHVVVLQPSHSDLHYVGHLLSGVLLFLECATQCLQGPNKSVLRWSFE